MIFIKVNDNDKTTAKENSVFDLLRLSLAIVIIVCTMIQMIYL